MNVVRPVLLVNRAASTTSRNLNTSSGVCSIGPASTTDHPSGKVQLALLFLRVTKCYPTGAPQDVCETLDPSTGHGGKPMKTLIPYHLTTDVKKVDSNGHVFFRIRAKPPATFQGFMVQAIGEREEKPIGTFTDMEDVKLLECFGKPDNTATHTDNEPKEEVVLRWVPDNDYSGRVFFTATVVKTMKEYWVRKTAKPVTVQRAKA